MSDLKLLFSKSVAFVLRLTLWLLGTVVALLLLLLALTLLAVGALWALLRGRKPTVPVFVGRFQRYGAARVWPRSSREADAAEVVDVEVREVRDVKAVLPTDRTRPSGPVHGSAG